MSVSNSAFGYNVYYFGFIIGVMVLESREEAQIQVFFSQKNSITTKLNDISSKL